MDSFDAAKVVHERILEYETDPIASKIVGYVYLQESPEQEMIRLALAPDNVIQTLVNKAKLALQLAPISPAVSRALNPITIPDPSAQCLRFASNSSQVRAIPPCLEAPRCWDTEQQNESLQNYDSLPMSFRFENRFMSLDDRIEPMNLGAASFGDYCYNEAAFNNLSIKQSPLDVPVKICHYFNKGFCKHGNNCRYLHGQAVWDNYSQGSNRNLNEFCNEDQSISPGSLAKLEKEITDLLKSRGGNPISIASLPSLYSETYGRELEGEGYLRESQRHGKAGYSLTKLLARMKNIRLIDRPHGQHVVILAEDAPNYLVLRGERNDPGPIVSNSRQIYLTFPAESTFTEEDVSNYFSAFGAVQDVRIPCQQKRMFGFVTFVSSDTVKIILAKGNPHYVCGARVLVKPYREKSKLVERKYHEKLYPSMYYPSHHFDFNSELQAIESLRHHQLMEVDERMLEIQMRRLQNMKLIHRTLPSQSYFSHSTDEVKVSEDYSELSSPENISSMLFNVLNSDPTVDDNNGHSDTNYTDNGSNQGLNLSDGPFAPVVASNVSAVV